MRRFLPTLLIAGAAIGIGLYAGRDVWQRYREERLEAERAKIDMHTAEVRKADLQKQKAELESEAGRERLARERGWLKPGENRL